GRHGGELHGRRPEIRPEPRAPGARLRRRGARHEGALRPERGGHRAPRRPPAAPLADAARAGPRAAGAPGAAVPKVRFPAPRPEPGHRGRTYNRPMRLYSESFNDMGPIPARCAFCAPDPKSHVTLSEN